MTNARKISIYYIVTLLFIVVFLASCTDDALSGQATKTKRVVPREGSACTQADGTSGVTVWSYIPGDNIKLPPPMDANGLTRVGCCQRTDCITLAGECFDFDQVHGVQWICGNGNDWDICGAAGNSRTNKYPGDRSDGGNYVCEQAGSTYRWTAPPASPQAVIRNDQVSTSGTTSGTSSGATPPAQTITAESSCTAPPSGLVAHWAAEGNTNDNTGWHDGIKLGSVSFTSGRISGQAFSFPGTSAQVRVIDPGENSALDITGGITVAAWVNTADTSGTILQKGDGNGVYNLKFGVNNRPSFSVATADYAGRTVEAPYGYVFPANEWVFITGTADAQNRVLKLYVNGVLINTYSIEPSLSLGRERAVNDGPIIIGENLAANIDDVMIYNQEFSESDILNIMNMDAVNWCPQPRPVPSSTCLTPAAPLVSWWPGENNARDSVGGKHGLLLNAPQFTAGHYGQSFSFPGTSTQVRVIDPGENSALDIVSGITVAAWVNTAGNSGTILRKGDGNGVYSLEFGVNNRPRFSVATVDYSGRVVEAPGGYTFPANEWVFIAGTADAQNRVLKLYINGALANVYSVDSSTPDRQRAVNEGPIIIGEDLAANIDDVMIFNDVLSRDQLQRIFRGEYYCLPSLPTPASSCLTEPSGIISWWPGDAAGEDLQNSNTGVLVGEMAVDTGYIQNAFSNPLGIGTARMEVVDSDSLDITGDMTVAAWINTANRYGTVLRKGEGGGVYKLGFGNSDRPHFSVTTVDSAGRTVEAPLGYALPANEWVFIAGTADAQNRILKLYVNGVLANVYAVDPSVPVRERAVNDGPIIIGENLQGKIDEVILMNRMLSEEEMSNIYLAGSYGICKS